MKAYVEAWGCTLNFGEAHELEDILASKGWESASAPEGADLVVLATCVVVDKTERAMLKRLGKLSSSRRLIVTGCMATACREKALRIAPRAEFLSPGDKKTFSDMVGTIAPLALRPSSERGAIAIVPIATGCLGSCSYCITRLARGDLRSRPPKAVVEAVCRAVSDGPKEIQLTAQDTAAYGRDIDTDLPSLVGNVCAIPHDFRARIGMMNPRNALPIAGSIAEMLARPKVFKFLHLPVQSGSDSLLEDMGREYSVKDFLKVVATVRRRCPEASISTDLIVGYPGETDEDHVKNLELVSEVAPDIVNVTKFSSRPGTRAATLGKTIVGWKAKERSREITKRRFEVALERNRSLVGRKALVLATERGKVRSTIMRTEEYRQVVIPGEHPLGRYYNITITGATTTYLRGKIEGAG